MIMDDRRDIPPNRPKFFNYYQQAHGWPTSCAPLPDIARLTVK
jgi:hypothetical protein